jgi:hypothetical protein
LLNQGLAQQSSIQQQLAQIQATVDEILRDLNTGLAASFQIQVTAEGATATTMTFTDGSNLLLTITNILDSNGQPTTLTTVPVWTSSDATILAPTAAADGLSATGTCLKSGTVTITATAGPGDNNVSASVAITVTAGTVVSFQIDVVLAPTTPPSAAKAKA